MRTKRTKRSKRFGAGLEGETSFKTVRTKPSRFEYPIARSSFLRAAVCLPSRRQARQQALFACFASFARGQE